MVKLEQVVMNPVNNAGMFAQSGEIRVSLPGSVVCCDQGFGQWQGMPPMANGIFVPILATMFGK